MWTIHPKHLDAKGLLAAWREALLAQKVLEGKTKGYRSHPQLRRFKSLPDPVGAIAAYLRALHREAEARGYQFSAEKIHPVKFTGRIACTRGQLLYEWNHLKRKLQARDEQKYRECQAVEEPEAHPLFRITEGGVEDWEIV